MATEIERKYLVKNSEWRKNVMESRSLEQGYFDTAPSHTLRVRVDSNQAFLTIKGRASGISRSEFEYPIPKDDALAMLAEFCKNRILKKTRHMVRWLNHTWEVDEFEGDNAGLITAEIELHSETEKFEIPPWIGQDISHEKKYTNAALAQKPFRTW